MGGSIISHALEQYTSNISSDRRYDPGHAGQLPKSNPDITVRLFLLTTVGEFKGAVTTLLKQRDIRKIIRTLGGNPRQNGMVERSNGELKILYSTVRTARQCWENLPHATEVNNQQYNRGIGLAPADAVRLKRNEQDN